MIIDEENYLAHYGILRKSGRYPWGSGGNSEQRARSFIDTLRSLRDEGLSDVEISRMFSTDEHPFTVKMLREANTIARNEKKAADIAQAVKYKERQFSNVAIGKKMGIPESSVRSLLKEYEQQKIDILKTTASMLRDEIAKGGFIDIGAGVAARLQISNEKLASAVAILKDEGYPVHKIQTPNASSKGKQMTTHMVVCPPGTTRSEVWKNQDQIRQINMQTKDGGRTYFGILPPLSISSRNVKIKFAEDGGADEDGVLYLRPGKDITSLGGKNYAQVRVLVDGTHYLKGMAVYKNDLPQGTDILFATNKSRAETGGDKFKVMKEVVRDEKGNVDMDNPFGAVISSQVGKRDATGAVVQLTSAINKVYEEGEWGGWKNSISRQVLSKQSPKLAKEQLDIAYQRKKQELDEINALTNPIIKRKLLSAYAESTDYAAVEMKAASFDRQSAHAILPVNSLKETEVYAPNYRNGERVALIRFPHAGTFEIPELVVNNKNQEAIEMMGRAQDAVGINTKVAQRLSGADFDGDTVLVIPNNKGQISTSPALTGLKNFDPKTAYPPYEGMVRMPESAKGRHMGYISNLITDMTIQGASNEELARAVRHSMVVIDAPKHGLDYKRSEQENGIPALMKRYQPKEGARAGGAATLISKATARQEVPDRKPRSMPKGGPIDKATGKKVYEYTNAGYTDKNGVFRPKTLRSTKLAEAEDARSLMSNNGRGTPIEKVYADHSNRLKALANEARRLEVAQPNIRMSRSAKEVYKKEVESLNAKLNLALRNSPLERQAQTFTNHVVAAKKAANPHMDGEQLKRVRRQALAEGRARVGAKKERIEITEKEWDAIQAGAISTNKLRQILNNTDIEKVKTLATPRPTPVLTSGMLTRAKQMAAAGRTQAEIADALGIGLTTLKKGLNSG